MMLPFGQEALIEALLNANPNTIIVLVSGGPVDMRAWNDQAKAIVQAWYAGMEGGHALADILFGEVNPSGKLPMTFPEKLEDSPAHSLAQYPDENLLIDHKEDIFVGYRYFDSYEVEPAYAFGHGLSYTSFEYDDLALEKKEGGVHLKMKLTNTGPIKGAEVVQVYVQDVASSLPRPKKELKAFEKVMLEPGQSTEVSIELKEEAFKYFDDQKMEWVLEPGQFVIHVGSSSRDIRLSGELEL
jgi:beta-glucosidase